MKLITALCCFAAIASIAAADPRIWNAPLAVRQGSYIQSEISSAKNAAGDMLLVWSDARTGDMDIRAQLVRPDGSPQWGEVGISVVSAVRTQNKPMVVAVSDGWIVAWHDQRPPDNSRRFGQWIRAQKLGRDGAIRWLDNGGTGVIVGADSADDVSCLCPDGTGGAFAVWQGAVHGTIRAQRILGGGSCAWAETRLITQCGGDILSLDADADNAGNLFVGWECSQNRVSASFAAKVTAQGELAWGEFGVPLCADPVNQSTPRLRADASGGCYVVWSVGMRTQDRNLFIQHFNENGQHQWEICGALLCNAEAAQSSPRLDRSNNGPVSDGLIVVWEDYRVNGYTSEIYAQKVSLQGQPVWTPNGVKLCGNAGGTPEQPTGNLLRNPRLISDQSGGLISVWIADTTGSTEYKDGFDLHGGRLLADGSRNWGDAGVHVAVGPNGQYAASLQPNAGAMVFFYDLRSNSATLRAQQISVNGQSQWPDTGLVLTPGCDGFAGNVQTAVLGSGRLATVWHDQREINHGFLRYQLVNSDGTTERPAGGIPLVTPDDTLEHNVWSYQVCPDGHGGFFVVFIDVLDQVQTPQIRLIHVNDVGELITNPAGQSVLLVPNVNGIQDLRCAADSLGGCYIAYACYNEDWMLNLGMMRVNSLGEPQWTVPIVVVADMDYTGMVGMLGNPDGTCTLVWRGGPSDHYNIQSVRIHPTGWVMDQRTIADDTGSLDSRCMISDGNGGFYIAWIAQRETHTGSDVVVQHIGDQGQEIWTPGGETVRADYVNQHDPAIALDSDGNLFVFWADSSRRTSLDVFGQKLSPNADRLWPATGLPVCTAAEDQNGLQAVSDGGSGVFVVWADHRNRDYWTYQGYGTHLQGNGVPVNDPYWTENGNVITELDYRVYGPPVICRDGSGDFSVAWVRWSLDNREDYNGYEVLLQRFRNLAMGTDTPPAVANTFELAQNFPNPFNPSTSISFSLSQAGQTKLTVYNVLGEEVARLTDRVMPAGKYRLTYNASALSSGIYFYRLESPAGTLTRRMLLLK